MICSISRRTYSIFFSEFGYTKQVREYCENHKGTIIDVSKVKDEEFSEIPYKTLLKILNRLEEEKILTSVSKGVYSIGKLKSGSQPNVLKQYIGDGKGMVVGYMLYNSKPSFAYLSKYVIITA